MQRFNTDANKTRADGNPARRPPRQNDLTRFQYDILIVLGRDGPTYGLALKQALEQWYDEEINHGRLYPNLDDLAEADLIDKRELDGRTNEYELTDAGRIQLRRRAQQFSAGLDGGRDD